ncbi:lipid IV(A) 3-deoxy-D-manno-octulosonic acid transferase [Endozoicomonadaceae bacterium StTr2]
MNRTLYNLLLHLLFPAIFLRLLYRAWRAPAYAKRWGERFGFFPKPESKPCIWVHSVSVGESIAAAPLVKALLKQYPDHRIAVTTMTPTGSAQVKKQYGDQVFHVYAPYDYPWAVSNFLNRLQPEIAIIMETELWPNIIHQCHQRDIPVMIANARLSERSAKGYGKLGKLTREMLSKVSLIAAQAEPDGQRFIELGLPADKMEVTGNIKFDISIPDSVHEKGKALRQQWLQHKPDDTCIIVAGSTHEGEDELLLDACKQLRKTNPNTLLVLVPRHPERFNQVYELSVKTGEKTARYSTQDPVEADTSVVVADVMGELLALYAAGDIAFVGGSLIPSGGHNMLEPAALRKPVVSGPHVFNFSEVFRMLDEANAVLIAHSSDDLVSIYKNLCDTESFRETTALSGFNVIEANQGATNHLIQKTIENI